MNYIFTVLISDRHSDDEIRVFEKEYDAVHHAKNIAKDNDHHGDYEESEIAGWIFYAVYSCEGDSVRVERKYINR